MKKRLIIILGDQLNSDSPVLQNVNPDHDIVVMTEATHEAIYVWQHKKRLVLFFSAMRHFASLLQQAGMDVVYHHLDNPASPVTLAEGVNRVLAQHTGIESVLLVRPGDYRVLETLEHVVGKKLHVIEDTHFLTTPKEFQSFLDGRKRVVLEDFYRLKRKQTGWLMGDNGKPFGGAWNFDKQNRQSFNKNQSPLIPDRVTFAPDKITKDVIKMVNVFFPDAPGRLDNFCEPVTKAHAFKVLEDFVHNRLYDFGAYQDAITFEQPTLYHSRLSTCLNLRLISPYEVCTYVLAHWEERKIPINSVEGFIRQILGWREFVHGIYWTKMPVYARLNTLNATADVPTFFWTGETDMACLRDCTNQLVEHAYAHHIQRLMVMGLFLMMYGADPYKVHEWHMGMYLDAIDWVSLPNVVGMSQYGDGGLMGTKPYCATGAYVNKMSPYCKSCRYDPKQATGDKACPFTTLYWDFLSCHEETFSRNPRMTFQLKNLKNKSDSDLGAIRQQVDILRTRL